MSKSGWICIINIYKETSTFKKYKNNLHHIHSSLTNFSAKILGKMTSKLYSMNTSRSIYSSGTHLWFVLWLWRFNRHGFQILWKESKRKSNIFSFFGRFAVLSTDSFSLTVSVVRFWSEGDEDPGQSHQHSHHQVHRHPRVQNLVLQSWRPGGNKGNVSRTIVPR